MTSKNNKPTKRTRQKSIAQQKVVDFMEEFNRELEPLSDKEKAFVLRYLQTFNKRAAVELAMPATERVDTSATILGTEILNRPEVKRVVKAFFDKMILDTVEISARFAVNATASMEDFLEVDEETGMAELSFKKANERGVLSSIKKAKFAISPVGKVYVAEVELKDATDALNSLARINGMFNDKLKVSTDDEGETPFDKMIKRMKGKK